MNLAKIAYDAYGDNRNWVVYSGDKMPSWEEQSEELKAAWVAAAAAVENALSEQPSDTGDTNAE